MLAPALLLLQCGAQESSQCLLPCKGHCSASLGFQCSPPAQANSLPLGCPTASKQHSVFWCFTPQGQILTPSTAAEGWEEAHLPPWEMSPALPQCQGLSPWPLCTHTHLWLHLLPSHGDAVAELQMPAPRTPHCPALPIQFMVAVPRPSAWQGSSGNCSMSDARLWDWAEHAHLYGRESWNTVCNLLCCS